MACNQKARGTLALAVFSSDDPQLRLHEFGRPDPAAHEVEVHITHCGICASDTHTVNGDWGVQIRQPLAVGHEIVGVVGRVGAEAAAAFAPGQRVGVGCFVDSCARCDACSSGLENMCARRPIQTYGSPWRSDTVHPELKGQVTCGGYSQRIVVNQHFVFPIPDALRSEHAAPLLCAGITMFAPLKRYGVRPGHVVGIAGFGGLGQMGVKLAKAMGAARVIVFSRSDRKRPAAEALGAELVVSSDRKAMKALVRNVDVILDTISHGHPLSPLVKTLKVGGTLVLIGGVPDAIDVSQFLMLAGQYQISGSSVGGVPQTHEMLKFCAEHGITPEIEVVTAAKANDAFQRVMRGDGDARRYVIDMRTLKRGPL